MANRLDSAINNTMALTLSPPESKNTPKFDYYNQYLELLAIIKPVTSKFILYPEIDKTGRLHYHGTLTIKDDIKLFTSTLPKLRKYGFIKIKEIKTYHDELKWKIYTMKEWAKTQVIVDSNEPIYRKRVHRNKQVKPDTALPIRSLYEYGFISEDPRKGSALKRSTSTGDSRGQDTQ